MKRAYSVIFPKDLSKILAAYIPTIREHFQPDMLLASRLAPEHGIAGYESLQAWTQTALARYRRAAAKGASE